MSSCIGIRWERDRVSAKKPGSPHQGCFPLSCSLPLPGLFVCCCCVLLVYLEELYEGEKQKKKDTHTQKPQTKTTPPEIAVTAAALLPELPQNFLHAELSLALWGRPNSVKVRNPRAGAAAPSARPAAPCPTSRAGAAAAALPCGHSGPAAGLRPPPRTAPAASHRPRAARSARQEPPPGSGGAGAPRAP